MRLDAGGLIVRGLITDTERGGSKYHESRPSAVVEAGIQVNVTSQ